MSASIERQRMFRAKHRDRLNAEARLKYANNPNEKLDRNKLWYVNNKAKSLAISKAWVQNNRERVNLYHRLWTKKNPEKAKAKYDKWRRNHPEKYLSSSRNTTSKRRALKRGSAVNVKGITAFMVTVRSKKSIPCYYCHRKISGSLVHFDHIVALSLGGIHAVENLCATCQDCNQQKHAKSIPEWNRSKSGQLVFLL